MWWILGDGIKYLKIEQRSSPSRQPVLYRAPEQLTSSKGESPFSKILAVLGGLDWPEHCALDCAAKVASVWQAVPNSWCLVVSNFLSGHTRQQCKQKSQKLHAWKGVSGSEMEYQTN